MDTAYPQADPDAYSGADPGADAAEPARMIEGALWVAMVCALCGALTGNRTAWVLLVSVSLCLALDQAGVPFSLVRWLIFDTLAMALILLLSKLTQADWLILALFFAGWAAYCLPDPYRYTGTMAVTILQLLLTFPLREAVRRLVGRWKANFQHRNEWTDLEKRGANA